MWTITLWGSVKESNRATVVTETSHFTSSNKTPSRLVFGSMTFLCKTSINFYWLFRRIVGQWREINTLLPCIYLNTPFSFQVRYCDLKRTDYVDVSSETSIKVPFLGEWKKFSITVILHSLTTYNVNDKTFHEIQIH